MTQQEILIKIKDPNSLIDPVELVQLIEQVGMWIDDLDLEIIESEARSNAAWACINNSGGMTNTEVTCSHRLGQEYQSFKKSSALLKSLRRHYRLLQTKLNLITKPRGR